MKNMVKMGLVVFLATAMSAAFGQQLLWSTAESDSLKGSNQYIPIDNVLGEVMKIYDYYTLYYDFAGFTKEAFLESVPAGVSIYERNKLDEIDKPTVLAIRTNLGRGSVVFVVCVSKDNVNSIVFSNSPMISGMDYRFTYSADREREKFKEWFKTLLN